MFKLCLTVLSFLLIGSSGAALAGAGQDCDNLRGDASIQACDQAIRENPRDAVSYNNRGVTYFKKGDFDRALADYSEAVEINPKLAVAYNNRGVIFEEKGDLDRAIADSDKAIEIDPKYAPAYSNRGNALRKGGNLDRAIADYTTSIEIDPLQNNGAHLNAYYGRGFAFQLKRDLDRAMTDYAKAIEVDPKHALAYIGRGFILLRVKGDLDGAIDDYTKAIEVDPTHALPYIGRAEAYQDKSDVDRAFADYAKALEVDPKSAAAYNSRCRFRAKANLDLPLALSDCDDAVRLAPNNANYRDNRGFLYLKLNRLDDAIADYDAALRINPKQVGALYGRGLAKQKNGDPAGGDADIAAARAIKATIADEFAKYGVN